MFQAVNCTNKSAISEHGNLSTHVQKLRTVDKDVYTTKRKFGLQHGGNLTKGPSQRHTTISPVVRVRTDPKSNRSLRMERD